MIYIFVTDECDCCGRTTVCTVQQDDMDLPIDSMCEPCSVGSDETLCPDGYHYRESVRRGSLIDEPATHAQAWDHCNYHEDMRLRRDIVVIDIEEEL